jgi:glycine oxidase
MNIVIIGGGVIGLSTAWELASRGHKITLADSGQFGRKASWAGAGILLPGNASTAIHPLERLEAASNDLHQRWARRLLHETGIDNGYRKCGGVYVATTAGEVATLAGSIGYWDERKIDADQLSREEFLKQFPTLSHLAESKTFLSAWMPDEAQICNPWHNNRLLFSWRTQSLNSMRHRQRSIPFGLKGSAIG